MERAPDLCYNRIMSELNLFNYFRSSTSYRVRIALELKNLSYTYTPVHLVNNGGEQNSENYRQLNPIGGVPTLMHGDRALSQSFAIVEYLDETFNSGAALFPRDAFARAKVRQFCELINADIHPLQNLRVMQYLEKQIHLTPEQKNTWLNKWIVGGLTAAEKTIADFSGTYCFGNEVTAADLFLIPQLFSAQRFQIDITHFKKLAEINERCLQLPGFRKAHPYRQVDTPDDLRIP